MIPSVVKKEKPIPRSRRKSFRSNESIRFSGLPSKENRAEQIRRSDDTFKGISIGLQDIDEAVLYYFEKVIKPTIDENGQMVNVPIRYGSPEHWKFIQKDGYLKDQKGKIIAPFIIFRRSSISKNNDIAIDKLNRNIVHQFPIKYSDKNRYDRFSLLAGSLKPTYEIYNMIVPDYIVVDFECIILTSFISQMNNIIEKIFYNEEQFWGDPKKFKFSTIIDSFDQNIDISTDQGRLIKSTFNLQLKGYLIPEYYGDHASVDKKYSVQQIILGTETTIPIDEIFKKAGIKKYRVQNEVYTTTVATQAVENEVLTYLLKEKWKKANSITSNYNGESIVTFENTTMSSAPTGISATNKNDYLFFTNGFYMEHDAIRIAQVGNNFVLYSNISEIGYEINDTDEVYAWGFFN